MAKLKGQLADLYREFKPGYKVGSFNGSGHIQVVGPDGNVVRQEGGLPVTLPASPGALNGHGLKRLRQNLVAAGVIEKGAGEELVERMSNRPPLELPAESEEEPRYQVFPVEKPTRLPSIMLNVDWEEYLALERAAGYVVNQGPRQAEKMQTFLRLADRARTLMERRVEERNRARLE